MSHSKQRTVATIDGNEAVAQVAYQLNEVIALYPITPSTPMGEWADVWSAEGKPNLWGTVPTLVEMQSEAGVAGTMHGALQTGALATTFTASQGLLLMIPNLYKLAGELTPTVFHVAARSLAAQALSIFGDHSDVMATRATGFAMLCSASVQEAHDFALIAQAATLQSRLPFLHFFDGFRTSHEIAKIALLDQEDVRSVIHEELIHAHRSRALSPDHPVLRGTTQNPDVYFQARETVNAYYAACPDIVQTVMDQLGQLTGRPYHLFDYHGAPDAERVIVLMGSGCEAVHETVDYLNAFGDKVGVVKVRLYRPFDLRRFVEVLPASVKAIAVLDRTKEPGSTGEPLYLDVVNAVYEEWERQKSGVRSQESEALTQNSEFKTPLTSLASPTLPAFPLPTPHSPLPKILGGRYGLSSKEFTPAMIKGIFDNLAAAAPKNHFTVGINDDVTHTSLDYDPEFSIESDDVIRAIFYGLGADGTVGANKNSIKIIGEETDRYAQGYFVYDSKKSGSVTISHLRFGTQPIRSPYLISKANFIACHQPVFLERFDLLQHVIPGGTFLLNTPYTTEEIWHHLPQTVQQQIIDKHLKVYIINASKVARDNGMGGHINTVMQVCFFAVSGVLTKEEAIAHIKQSIEKTYRKKGDEIVQMNLNAVDQTLENLHEVNVLEKSGVRSQELEGSTPAMPDTAPAFVREVLGSMIAGCGDQLPVSALPADGTYPTGTAKYEKRNIAQEIPVWDTDVCVQCGKCVMVCPHSVIRSKVYDSQALEKAPETFKHTTARDHDWQGLNFTIQVAPEDCTGCGICVDVCPAKNKAQPRLKAINMEPQPSLRESERTNWDFFLNLPNPDRRSLNLHKISQQQMQEPLFEFSGACAGCGETPYLKLVSQLFGDRALIANATGCSSIYGGNLPTTPWSYNEEGRGPAWSNSLFEDNAEFGLGFRVSIDKQREFASELLQQLVPQVGENLVNAILNAVQRDEADIYEQRERVAELKKRLQALLVNTTNEISPSPPSKGGNQLKVPLQKGDLGGSSMTARSDRFRISAIIQNLKPLVDLFVKKSVWIVGGDGWAYDIGFGGLDHVLASGRNVNVLVLDTEVYSNTGGQMSKATPRGAVAKFAAGGKPGLKKDLGLMAMTYGNVYVASVAMGARDEHTLKAFLEAEAYEGPSLIIAYSHCIAHGIDMRTAMQNQKAVVNSGRWLLYRYHPDRRQQGENPLQLDSHSPKIPLERSMYLENRFKMLTKSQPEAAKRLLEEAQDDVNTRWQMYHYLATQPIASRQEGENHV